MEFGLIMVPQVRGDDPEPFDKVTEQIEYAEQLGFDVEGADGDRLPAGERSPSLPPYVAERLGARWRSEPRERKRHRVSVDEARRDPMIHLGQWLSRRM